MPAESDEPWAWPEHTWRSHVDRLRAGRSLARHGIPVSFYVPAVCALLRPAEIRSCVDAGHEVGMHGWIHERNVSLDPILADGEPTGMVEIPVEWIRDDAPYFTMDRFTQSRPYTAPRQVLTIWRDEFDAAYRAGGLFQLTMHPHVIGHRSRFAVLIELVEYITGHPHVWYATHADIARYVLDTADGPDRR